MANSKRPSKRSKDDQKTKKELIDELAELRRKLSEDKPATRPAATRKPTLSGDISRRDALKIAWVTPVILSVPLGFVGGARRAEAQLAPTMSPTTMSPTTMAPTTMAPTTVPTVPTMRPTVSPTTVSPTSIPTPPTIAPTASPGIAPTAFPSARAAVPALSTGGAAAAAAILFGVGAKVLRGAGKPEKDAGAPQEPASSDGSDDDDGSGEK